ncbi:acyltransferase [Aureococcus anophagefferens]|uniref:Acyltransferase n=1 Tax=Aureococcus anophagefferens TaxID=44056 RepID=A0ABR1FXA7_AURAN
MTQRLVRSVSSAAFVDMVARALRAETVDDDSSEAWARASTYLAAGHFSSLGDRDGCKSIYGYEYFLVALGRRTASGLCLPRACAPDDLRRFLDGARFTLDDPELPAGPAYVSDDRFRFRLDELGVVVVVATAALALLAAAATYLHAAAKRDVLGRGGDPEAARDALPAWLLAFSAVENVGALLRPRGPGALKAFDGMRVLSLCWVVAGHVLLWPTLGPTTFANEAERLLPGDSSTVLRQLSAQVVPAAEFAVDTFFLLSGFLGATSLADAVLAPGAPGLAAWWPALVARRLARLVPAYAYVLLAYWKVQRVAGRGALWSGMEYAYELCDEYWWTNALLVNNLVPWGVDDRCYGPSWYIAVDAQLAVLALPPCVAVAARHGVKRGVAFLAALAAASTVFTWWLASTKRLTLVTFQSSYINDVYIRPWTRAPPYLVGVGAALLWRERRSTPPEEKRSTPAEARRSSGWLLSLSLGVLAACAFGALPFRNASLSGARWRAEYAYLALSKPAWALGVAAVALLCFEGRGSVVGAVLDLDVWAPAARLTYCAYLVHAAVLDVVFHADAAQRIHYSAEWYVVTFLGAGAVIVVTSLAVHLLVEAPAAALLRGKTREPAAEEKRGPVPRGRGRAAPRGGLRRVGGDRGQVPRPRPPPRRRASRARPSSRGARPPARDDGRRAAARARALVSEASFRPPLTVFERGLRRGAAGRRGRGRADRRAARARDAAIKRAAPRASRPRSSAGACPAGSTWTASRRRSGAASPSPAASRGRRTGSAPTSPAPLSLAESLRDCALLAALARENGLAVVAASGRPAAAAWALFDDASVLSCGRLLYCGAARGARAPRGSRASATPSAPRARTCSRSSPSTATRAAFGAGDTMRGPSDAAGRGRVRRARARARRQGRRRSRRRPRRRRRPGARARRTRAPRAAPTAPGPVARALAARGQRAARGVGGLARRDVAGAPDASALWVAAVALGALAAAPGLADDHRGFALERGGGAPTGPRARARATTLAAEGALVVAVHAPAAYLFASLARLPRPLDFACAATPRASLHGAARSVGGPAPRARRGLAALLLAVKFGASFAAVALSDETWITHFSTFKLADDAPRPRGSRRTTREREDGTVRKYLRKLSDGDDVEKEKEAALERLWAGLIDEHGEHLGLGVVGGDGAMDEDAAPEPEGGGKLLRLDLKEIKALRAMGRAIKGYFSLAALPNGGARRKYAQQKVDAVMEAVTPADGAAKNLLRGISRVCCGDNNDDVRLDTFAGRCTKKVKIVTVQVDSDGRRTLVVKEEHHQRHTKHAGDLEIYQAFLKSAGYASHLAAHPSHKISFTLFKRAKNHTNLDVFVVASDPRLVDVTVKHADGSSSFVKKRITDNHAWKFYAGASGKGKDNDYFFHHAALTHLVDFYVAKRVKDNKPPLTRIDAKTSKSRRSTLSLDKYFYRFITWTQDDPIGVDDDDVFFADKSAKWSASPGLAEKDARLAALAPKIRKGDVVALGISQSERDAQGVDFYLAKVVVPPARADNQRRVNGSGRDGWNIKKGEFCLTVRWFDLKPCGYYEDYGSQDEQLLEMVIAVGDGAALVLEPAPRKGRARGAPAQFQLAKASEAAIHNENLDKYVDRAAAGSSA